MRCKDLRLANGAEGAGQRLAIGVGKRRDERALHSFHLARSLALPLLAGRRELGPDDTPVLGVVDPPHQPLALEAIHELSDVGAYAALYLGQVAEGERIVALGHLGEDAVLGHRETDRSECLLEALGEDARRLEDGEHEAVGGDTGRGVAKGHAERYRVDLSMSSDEGSRRPMSHARLRPLVAGLRLRVAAALPKPGNPVR